VTGDGGGTVPPVVSTEDASDLVSMQDAEVALTSLEWSPFVGDNPPAMLKRCGGPHDLSSNESPTKRRSFDEADSSGDDDDGETTSAEEGEEDPCCMRSMWALWCMLSCAAQHRKHSMVVPIHGQAAEPLLTSHQTHCSLLCCCHSRCPTACFNAIVSASCDTLVHVEQLD